MSNTSTFLPMGNITGIGSLPLHDPDEAVAFVESCALRIPFWPQLPQRAPSEGMIEQALLPFSDLLRRASRAPIYDVMPGASIELARRLDDSPAELDTTRAAGFFAFEKALSAGAFAEALALKGQIVGPVTLAAQLRIGGRPLLEARGSDIPLAIELFRALGWYATRLALWQVERLRRWRENVILMLDEPCLSLAACCASPVAQHALPILKEALAMIRVGGAVAGVHCCARLPTALVCQAHPDLISFDAHQGLAEVFTYPIIWLPEQPMWSNYARVFNLAGFDRMYLNSLFVAAASVTLNLLTASLAGFAFARLRFKGRDTLFLLYLATLMIPGQVTLIPVFILIRALGWYDSYAALIAPSAVSVFSTFLLRQFFRSIPMDLDEAARMDGAGSLRIWWQIALPLARPALATVAILGLLGSWNDFLWPLIVIHSRSLWTIPLGLSAFQGQYNVEWHLLMAGASIAVLPILLVYLVGQKWIVQATAVASRENA